MHGISATPRHLKNDVIGEVVRSRIIAILRGDLKGKVVEIVETLLEAGISAVEVTLNSPDPYDSIATIRQAIKSPFALGAGTVLREDEVLKANDSGASFIVSPNMSPKVIRATKRLGMASFPGCSTCTEILDALDYGADAAKIFPASAVSPEGIRAIRASLGAVLLIPTGGITLDNASHYRSAGAWALGVGSSLFDSNRLQTMTELRIRAVDFVKAVNSK